jgi:hypothetical protein
MKLWVLPTSLTLQLLHLHLNEHQYSHSVLPRLTCPTIRVILAQFILRCDSLLKRALVASPFRASNLSAYECHIIIKSGYRRDHAPCLYNTGPDFSTRVASKLVELYGQDISFLGTPADEPMLLTMPSQPHPWSTRISMLNAEPKACLV